MHRSVRWGIAAAAVALAGCGSPQSIGGIDTIAVVVDDGAWADLEEPLREALEPRRFMVRDERVFHVSRVSAAEGDRLGYRRLRQLLVIGTEMDPWVADALRRSGDDPPPPPALVTLPDVWARPQTVTLLLLKPGSPPSSALPLLPTLGGHYLERYERYARERMFVTGANASLADSLRRAAGFTLTVPEVYRRGTPTPGVLVLRNDQPDPSRLIREVQVDARAEARTTPSAEAALEWRRRLTRETTSPAQTTLDAELTERSVSAGGRSGVEIRGVWSNPPGEWPAAGPFITWMIDCPGRPILVDAWLYAPGRAKFEYVVQLEAVLESFRCQGP